MTLIRHSEQRHLPEKKDPANSMSVWYSVVLKIAPYSKARGYESG